MFLLSSTEASIRTILCNARLSQISICSSATIITLMIKDKQVRWHIKMHHFRLPCTISSAPFPTSDLQRGKLVYFLSVSDKRVSKNVSIAFASGSSNAGRGGFG
jgi:hypothetical protein